MRGFLKKRWIVLIVTQLAFTNAFSQDCDVNFFHNSYVGPGLFGLGGSQGDRLTILPDTSLVMCNSRFLARISKNGNVLWSKFIFGSVAYPTASNALVDYDGNIVCVMNATIIKMDTSGNMIYQKKMHFNIENGNDVTNSESFRDIGMLDNGDKVILYEDPTGPYGGYLFVCDRDMTVIKWCKSIRYNGISFTNMVIQGNKIVLSGLARETFPPAAFGFFAAFNSTNGSVISTNYFNCPNLGTLRRLYKGNGQYFLMGTLVNQSDAAGRYCYMRIDSNFNLLAIRRVVGYTDNFPTTLTLLPQNDNSLYGMIGRGGFVTTMFNIDKNDSVKSFKWLLITDGYPADALQNSEALFFTNDHDYNAVGVGAESSFEIFKIPFTGKVGNCLTERATTFVTNSYNFSAGPSVTLQVTDKVCAIDTGNSTFGNYNLNTRLCSYKSICDSIKLTGDTAICSSTTVYYTGRRNAGCNNPITWSVDPAADYTVVNDSMISVNYTRNGNYKITCKINDRCNEYNDSINVHVNLSGLQDMPGDSILCAGNTIRLSVGNQFKTYEWQDGSADSVFVVNSTGRYFVAVTDYCGNTYSDTININPADFYFSIGNDTVKCNGDSLILSATPGFYNYVWSSQYNLEAISDSVVMVTPMVDTLYIATAEKMPGCFVRDSVHITVLRSQPVFLGNDSSLCSGQSLLLDAGNSFSSYEWSSGDVSQRITVNSTGTYSVKATATNGCLSADTLQILNVSPLPAFTLGNDTTLCQGQKLSYNFNLPGATYLWKNGSNLNSAIIENAGLYWLRVTQQGCSAIDTINVLYQPSPVVYLGNDTVLCDDVTKQLDAFNNNATYLWQDGSRMASYLVTNTGLYFVTADISGCRAKDSVYINYKSKPDISLGRDTFVCNGQEIILRPVTTTTDNYLWQDGSRDISLEVKAPGVYTLTASNECGITTSSVKVDWGTCELYMPEAFTPNNDGINDLFRVNSIILAKQFSFSIYNRFGEIIFESNNINAAWDGSYKGIAQSSGAYVWIISFIGSNNIRKFAKGTVLLVR